MFSEGEGFPCPRCQRLTGTPGTEDDAITPEKDKLEVLEQKLQESESKLETTVVVKKYLSASFHDYFYFETPFKHVQTFIYLRLFVQVIFNCPNY